MKRLKLPASVLLVILFLALAAQPLRAFLAQDRCLDRGGRWNADTWVCEGVRS